MEPNGKRLSPKKKRDPIKNRLNQSNWRERQEPDVFLPKEAARKAEARMRKKEAKRKKEEEEEKEKFLQLIHAPRFADFANATTQPAASLYLQGVQQSTSQELPCIPPEDSDLQLLLAYLDSQ